MDMPVFGPWGDFPQGKILNVAENAEPYSLQSISGCPIFFRWAFAFEKCRHPMNGTAPLSARERA